MINENLKLSGQLNIVLKDSAGNIKKDLVVKNLVVNAGLAYIVSRMTGTDKSVMSHMSLGSGAATPAAGDTDLGTVLGSRETLDSTTISWTNDEKVVYVSSFEAGDATGAVTEAGIFNASSSGDMLCRTVFPVVNKAADDTMSVTWTITLSAV
jgi:hypothetical protein